MKFIAEIEFIRRSFKNIKGEDFYIDLGGLVVTRTITVRFVVRCCCVISLPVKEVNGTIPSLPPLHGPGVLRYENLYTSNALNCLLLSSSMSKWHFKPRTL